VDAEKQVADSTNNGNTSYTMANSNRVNMNLSDTKEDNIESKIINDILNNNFTSILDSQNLKNTVPTNANVYEEVASKSINDNELSKKISLGNTLISSETKELNVNNVNELIKDETTEMIPEKLKEKEVTQIINTENLKNDVNEETQKIDLNQMNSVSQETVVADNNLNTLPQNTIVMDKTEDANSVVNVQNEGDFSKIAEKMVESKLDFDNTQMIDTTKVREALKEENFESNPEFDEMYKKTFGVDPFSVRKEKELEKIEEEKINASSDFSYASENMNVFEEKEEEYPEISYKFLGIAFNTYIIIEIKNEMYVIDQHAAHERIMYEKVKANYYSEDQKDEQFLLLPDVITLTHKDMIIAKENREMFEKAGFSFEEFGENTIKLISVPSMCENLNTKQLFLDILDEIDTVAVTARQEKEDKFIATVACKAAVKAKMKLDEEEVKSLMEKLLELPNPFTCPHGRPTAIKMTKYDLEKKFSRR